MIELGLLEFGYRETGQSSMGAVGDIIAYAAAAEQAGIKRFWLGEHHHSNPLSAYSSPEPLIGILLASTERINVGVAGVLLNFHSPYTVALNYKMLANLFPSRVDLGFANGASSLEAVRGLLNRKVSRIPTDFDRNLKKICYMLNSEQKLFAREHLIIPLYGGDVPNNFLLSTSFNNLQKAIELNLNYSRSVFHNLGEVVAERERLGMFREDFAAANGRQPKVTLATMVCCSDSAAKAQRNFDEFVRSQGGRRPVNCIVGDGPAIIDRLEQYQQEMGIDEFTLLDCALNQKDKLKTIAILEKYD